MSVVWLDTTAATTAGAWWSRWGDQAHREAFDLEVRLSDLALGEHTAAPRHLTAAATLLWTVAAVVRRIVDEVDRGDLTAGRIGPDALDRLLAEVGVGPLPSHVSEAARRSTSSAFGDRGETGDREIRSPYLVVGATPVERGRHLVARAIGDTGDARQIRPDEFEIVRLDNGRYIVVLPGVVDLSAFSPGWHRRHRSVRDLDQAAFGSSRSTGVDDNPYARAVWDAVHDAGVPSGAELMVVGHSFGADTALDLAAEPGFNGAGGFRVTHVVAAGYHSSPQLPHLPSGTEVLVLQNDRDVPVILEAVGEAGVTEAAVSSASALGALVSLDPIGAARHHVRSIRHQADAWWSAASLTVDRADDLARIAVGVATADPRRVRDGVTGLVTLEPGVSSPAPGQVVSVFDGPGDGFGHAPSNYVSHVHGVDDRAVVSFLASVDAAGYTSPGVALAVDISVPG
jgi:hypothetical protein